MQESLVIPHRPEPEPGETKPGPEIQIIPPKPLEDHQETRPPVESKDE
jgi:hypothetical protein